MNIYHIQILLIYAITLLNYIFQYFQYEYINRIGKPNITFEILSCVTSISRSIQIFCFILLITTGYKINQGYMKKQTILMINILIILLLIFNSFYVALKERYESFKNTIRSLAAPQALLIIFILYISNNQYYKTLRQLVVFRETYKIKIFRRLRQIANFTVAIFMLFSCVFV